MSVVSKKVSVKSLSAGEINLATAKGRQAFWGLGLGPKGHSRLKLQHYLSTLEESPLRFGQHPMFIGDSRYESYFMLGKTIHGINTKPGDLFDEISSVTFEVDAKVPAGIIVNVEKRKQINCHVLINGDEFVPVSLSIEMRKSNPTTSFECLAQFYNSKRTSDTAKLVIKKLSSGELRVIDFDSDQTIPLTKKERATLKSKGVGYLLEPDRGFSVVGHHWHRSGSVLFHDTEKDWYILTGQDEGTFFGVQLCKPAKTVSKAMEDLVPDEAKNKSYSRQGEWFITSVDKKEVPNFENCAMMFEIPHRAHSSYSTAPDISLPRETDDSNKHYIHTYDGRVGKNGVVYALDPTLEHDQHEAITRGGWCAFYKNTAVRSFSQEGVD